MVVARRREDGAAIKQIAADFGISETCLQNWLRQAADVADGACPRFMMKSLIDATPLS